MNPTLTPMQALAHARRMNPALASVRMKARDEFVGMIDQGDGKMICVIVTYRVRELARETRITHKGTRTIVCMNGEIVSDLTAWYELPTPVIEAHFAVKNTPARVTEDVRRYQECYRPGTGGRFGERDSYARACQGYNS